MSKKLFNVLLFATGAAVGSLVTWKFAKTKYEQIIQEEIDSVKETWALMNRQDSDMDETVDDEEEAVDESDNAEPEEDPDVVEYYRLASRYVQSDEEDTENDKEGGGGDEVPYINGPYVITPDEFADGNYDHDIYSLSYYADGVLANDWFEVFDVDDTIGLESLKHFGDHTEDEDVMHVRNERLSADYEVIRDYRNYADVVANDPLLHMHAN